MNVLKVFNDKYICEINGQKYIVWQAKLHQMPLLLRLKNCKVYDGLWVAQKWLESSKHANINEIKPRLLLDIHLSLIKDIDGSWLWPLDDMWSKLSSEQKGCFPISWEDYKSKIEIVTPSKGSIIHGDIHPNNIVLSNDKIYLIDWEWCCIAPAEYDLAMLKQYMLANKYNNFILEYKKHKKINTELIDIYYKLCLFRCAVWALCKTKALCSIHSHYTINEYRSRIKDKDFDYSDLASAALAEFSSISWAEAAKKT